MLKLLHVAIGGAAGALLRYWASAAVHRFFSGVFPWGTLFVNLSGSLVIGFLWGISERIIVPQNIRLCIFIGILGSFTTFSTFTLENFQLLRDGEYVFAFTNSMLSLVLGMVLVIAGFFFSRFVFNIFR